MNKLIIAAAGAGKTTYIVENALRTREHVLIVTFTKNNEQEIKKKFIELNNGIIPTNITIQTWFSFLLQHGVKPYQSCLFTCLHEKDVTGMILVNKQSTQYIKEIDTKHYFSSDNQIYSDKLAKFVIKCNEASKNLVLDRLSRIYSTIYIDEVQDLAGYDLEIIKQMFLGSSNIILVGDPRQATYSTHTEAKYKNYNNGKIKDFISKECEAIPVEIDDTTLSGSYRNNAAICAFSSKLYPGFEQCVSKQKQSSTHSGLFFVKENDVDSYLATHSPVQLRYSRAKEVNKQYDAMNFGNSKGLGFDHVLIYPTKNIIDWILNDSQLAPSNASKLYVAITRAFHSVAFVYDYTDSCNVDGIQKWNVE